MQAGIALRDLGGPVHLLVMNWRTPVPGTSERTRGWQCFCSAKDGPQGTGAFAGEKNRFRG